MRRLRRGLIVRRGGVFQPTIDSLYRHDRLTGLSSARVPNLAFLFSFSPLNPLGVYRLIAHAGSFPLPCLDWPWHSGRSRFPAKARRHWWSFLLDRSNFRRATPPELSLQEDAALQFSRQRVEVLFQQARNQASQNSNAGRRATSWIPSCASFRCPSYSLSG